MVALRSHVNPVVKSGFTLIELSIVMVIIGLIIGGVLVGRDLISAAEVRAQISQIEKYQAAVNTFRGKYGYLPGDIPNPAASQYGFATRGSFAGQGDGNGLLEGVVSNADLNNCNFCTFGGETAVFWRDLSQARLVEGNFSLASPLAPPASVSLAQVGNYFPLAKITRGNYLYVLSGGWMSLAGAGDGVNYFSISQVIGSPSFLGQPASDPGLKVLEAFNIDKKIDDGLPQTGRVMAFHNAVLNGYSWAVGGDADPVYGANYSGDYDGDTHGPITSQTVSPIYADENGVTLSDTCYNNGDTLAPEHYSTEFNQGTGVNCALSFQFQ